MWDVNGLITRIFRRTFMDDVAVVWERSVYLEMFYFCRRPPGFQQQTHLSDNLYWNSNYLLSQDTPAENQCPGIQIH